MSRGFVKEKLDERDARHKRMGDSRYVVEPNVKEGKGGLRDLHALFWIGKYAYRLRARRRAGRGRPVLGRRAAPVPARRALPVGGALPPPSRRRPRRGAADLRLSARDRGADELCRPARQIAGRALHAPLFPAREDGRRPDRRLPRPSRREVRRGAAAASACPPSAAGRASSKASCSTAAGSPCPTTISSPRIRCGSIQMFALADRYGLEIHPLAMRAAARHAKLIDAEVRADPARQRPVPRRADQPARSRDGAALDERGRRVRPLHSRFRPRRRPDAVRHVPSLYGRRAFDPGDRPAVADRARRAEGGAPARHRPVQADRVAPRALRRGAAPRHRQGARRRP